MCQCICSVLVLKQQFVLDAFWQSNLLEHSIYVVGKWTIWTNYQKTNDNQMFQKNMEKWTHYNSSPIIKKTMRGSSGQIITIFQSGKNKNHMRTHLLDDCPQLESTSKLISSLDVFFSNYTSTSFRPKNEVLKRGEIWEM